MSQDKTYAVTIHCRIKTGYTGLLVAQCKELPAVIVQGKTMKDIRNDIFDGLEGYFKAFPDEFDGFMKKYGIIVESKEQKEQIDQKILAQEQEFMKTEEQLEIAPVQEEPASSDWQERILERVMTITA